MKRNLKYRQLYDENDKRIKHQQEKQIKKSQLSCFKVTHQNSVKKEASGKTILGKGFSIKFSFSFEKKDIFS